MERNIKASYSKLIKSIIAFGLSVFVVGYCILYNWPLSCVINTPIVISKGSSVSKVISTLKENTCFTNDEFLRLLMILTRNDTKVKPGRYNLREVRSVGQLMTMITSNSKRMEKLTILEGWSMHQTSRKVHEVLKVDTTEFIRLCSNSDFIKSLNIGLPKTLEGYLFPETYSFPKNRIMFDLTAREIIEVFIEQFKLEYEKKVKDFHNTQLKSMQEIITLASIVQGESVYIDEMRIVSSVYNNRLKKNWLLQADPTIQYLKPGKNKRLYNKDYKRFNSPYNTYIHRGLPPGPINSPGINAIIAAANPDDTDYMFFVARGDNRHHFSVTEEEHNIAKQKYIDKIW